MTARHHRPPARPAPPISGPGQVLTYAVLSLWAAVCLFPIYWVANTALKGVDDIGLPGLYLPFVHYTPTLDSWRFILFHPGDALVSRLVNSAVIGVGATGLTLIVASAAIYALTRFPPALRWSTLLCLAFAAAALCATPIVPGGAPRLACLAAALASVALAHGLRRSGPTASPDGLIFAAIATRLLSPVVLVLPLYLMAQSTGLRDTRTLMILTYAALCLPVALWLLLPVLGPRATEQEEAASLDGASRLYILFAVVLPMARGGLAAAGLVVFLLCWNEYLFAAYLTADHALTLPPWAAGQLSLKEAQVGGEAEEWAHLSAATLLSMLPALMLGAFVHSWIGRNISLR